ncbi:NEAT domain-containing protein [Alkalihalobacterium bogoriense]|uniref:NEAT domain-containing protein n=1 Tax=Alkalihalobacterium bogoriense TaxID=246272 RepID=UPI001FE0F296|nr:NEAT domain-containing protein [Alkalihalobacterium bogoriense]
MKYKKVLSSLLIFFIVFATLVPSTVGASSEPLADGEYTVGFTVLKDKTDDKSMMDSYTEKPATLFVEEGQYFIHLTLKNSDWIKEFKTDRNGHFVDAEVVSVDEAADKRVVRFKVLNLSNKLDAFTHVVIPFLNYDSKYTVQIKFDPASLTEINVPTPQEPEQPDPTPEEPEQPTEPEPTPEEPEQPSEPEQPDPTPQEPEQPTEPEHPQNPIELEDGLYSLGFKAIHSETDAISATDRYFTKPATLNVENGKHIVSFEINDSLTITALQVEHQGEFKDAQVVSRNEEKNTRVVQFEVDDVTEKARGKVSMVVGSYSATRDFRFEFYPEDAEKLPNPQPEQPSEPEPQPTEPELEEGFYSLDFKAIHAETDAISGTDSYFTKPATVRVENGTNIVSFEINRSSTITGLQVEYQGEFKDVIVVSQNKELNTRVVQFEVEDLTKKVRGKVSMVVGNYSATRDFRFEFYPENAESITVTQPETEEIDGKKTAVVDSIEHFQFKDDVYTVNNSHANTTFQFSNEVLAQLHSAATIAIPVGKEIKAEIPVSLLKDSGETAIFDIVDVSTAHQFNDARSSLYDFTIKIGDTVISSFEATPITLEFAVNKEKVINWDALSVMYVNTQGEKAEYIEPTYIHEQDGKVRAEVTHFSSYGVFEEVEQENENPPVVEQPVDEELQDGQYTIDFTVLKDGTNERSVMDQYTAKPALLVVENGNKHIDLTLTQSDWIKVFKVDVDRTLQDAEVVSHNTEENTRVVRFGLQDLESKLGAYTEVSVTSPIEYEGKYDVQFQFDASSVELVNGGEEEERPNPTPSPTPGPTPTPPTPPTQPTPTPGPGEEEGLADGRYTIDYTVLKNNTNEVSVMDDYTLKPAVLTVENGKQTIDVTLLRSEWVKVFQVLDKNNYVDAEVVSTDATTNTRVVRFAVEDLSALFYAYTEVLIPEISYDGKYYVQFQFDEDSITKLDGNDPVVEQPTTPPGTQPTNPESNEGTNPGTTNDDDKIDFDRDGDDTNNETTKETSKSKNPKTSDHILTQVILYLLLFTGSAVFLIRKYRLGQL